MLKSIGSNWGRIAFGIAVVLVLTPIVLDGLGENLNGVWVLINSTAGLLGLLLLGVPMTSVKFFSEHIAKRDLEGLNRSISACFAMYLALGAAALVIGAGLFGLYEASYPATPGYASCVSQGRVAYFLTVLYTAAGFLSQLPFGIMNAYGDFVIFNAISILGMILRLGLTIALMKANANLPALAAVNIAVIAFEFLVSIVVIKRRYPGVKLRPHGADRATIRRILGFSVFVLLLNVGYKLAFLMSSMVVSAFVKGDGYITGYNNGIMFPLYVTDLVLGIGQVVLPLAARLRAQENHAESRLVFLRWSKLVVSFALLPGLYLIVIGPEFIGWFLGSRQRELAGPVLQILMPSFLAFLPARGIALPMLIGRGKVKLPALALFLMGVINLGLSIALAPEFGINGVALGTAIPNVLFAAAVIGMACKDVGVPFRSWLAYATVRPLLGSLPVAGILLVMKQSMPLDGFLGLAAACAGTVLAFGFVSVAFVYANDPHVDVRAWWHGLLARANRSPSKNKP